MTKGPCVLACSNIPYLERWASRYSGKARGDVPSYQPAQRRTEDLAQTHSLNSFASCHNYRNCLIYYRQMRRITNDPDSMDELIIRLQRVAFVVGAPL